MSGPKYRDVVIIGGGFFGASIAIYIKEQKIAENVTLVERESDFMQHASYNNQARVHNGYHYPRSVLTAIRSRVNLPRFVDDYKEAIDDSFDKYYAVARHFSKVSAKQFYLFCEKIGAEIDQSPPSVKAWFNPQYIEDVFTVKEFAFNSRILKEITVKHLEAVGVKVKLGTEVHSIKKHDARLQLELIDGATIDADEIYNCTYSGINTINRASGLPLIPLKHEFTEMCLIDVPGELKETGVTVMCGPFFSFMPFPDKNLHSLSHVRYTPHGEWRDDQVNRNSYEYADSINEPSVFSRMIKDVQRYMPLLGDSRYVESLWETKTVLQQSESDDSRPILFKRDYAGVTGYHCVMGGKIDNIYDVFQELDVIYGKN